MNESTNLEFLSISTIKSDSTKLIFFGDKEILDKEIIKQVDAYFKSDPRIASISVSKSRGTESLELVKSQKPYDINVFLNQDLEDMVGKIPLNNSKEAEVIQWNDEATTRGLHHYSLVSKPMALHNGIQQLAENVLSSESLKVSGELTSADKTVRAPLRVLIDCEWIRENETGSQVATISLISELNAHPGISALGLLNWPNDVPSYASDAASLAKVRVVHSPEDFVCDVFWRPYQPSLDLNFLQGAYRANCFVITILDLISYNNCSYYPTVDEWRQYRKTFEISVLMADSVVCISSDVKKQLLSDVPHVESSRLFVAELGTDHLRELPKSPLESFSKLHELKGTNFVLIIGSRYAHKNIDFGIKVVADARTRGADLNLVIVGLNPQSDPNSEDFIKQDWIMNFGHVDPNERTWLISNAAAVLYPTSAEGFGFIPYESVELGTPVIATRFGPLKDILPENYSVSGWSVSSYASLLILLTSSNEASTEQISLIKNASANLTWSKSAQKLVDIFAETLDKPKNNALVAGESLGEKLNVAVRKIDDMSSELAEANALATSLTQSLSWRITSPIRFLHKRLTRN
jgi:glycosyltransferase involved in cell wall biosynthesis